MFVSDCLSVNTAGHLTIGGADTVMLAEKYGTPLYVMDENQIRANCRNFKNSIDKYYGGNGLVIYASKAFCCLEMCRIIKQEGLGIDVVSGGELYTALKAGIEPQKIFFHGNNKTVEELSMAISAGIGTIIVDNLGELEILNSLAKSANKKMGIMFRIKPGIEAHTHSAIMTGQIDSKFGITLENGEAFACVKKALEYSNIVLKGVHCHIGSQIFDIAPFEKAAQVMIDFIAQVKEELGYTIEQLNLGGGFGIKYVEDHSPVGYEKYMEAVSRVAKKEAEEKGIALPFICIEPGRSIVGPAGITLYRLGGIKEIPGIRTYISVDGGMCDNPRYALYQAEYAALIANKADKPREKKVTIAGKCCESGDLIQENILIQDFCLGDTVAILATGAYNYSMASHYNRIPNPAVVMVKDGEDRLVVQRESYDDLIKNDL